MLRMTKAQILAVLLACLWATSEAQLNRLKIPSHRTGNSKFSLNPLKPFMKLMRQDPMKAAAQRHHAKYLPPPPGMYQQQMALPSRASPSPYSMYPSYRPYPSQYSRLLPPSTMSFMPSYSAAPSTLMLSAMVNDHHYRPMSSDVQYKAVRIPSSKSRRPSVDTMNIADSVVRQLLDNYQQQQQQSESNQPSVLVIEDPDGTSSSGQSDIFGDSSQKVVMSPPLHAELSSDSSQDMSSNSAGNPEVFVIVSKNKSKNNSYYINDKKTDVISTSSSSSSPKLKKYKITSSYDENGDKQVWIIK